MNRTLSCDVAVVGAGAAGIAAAVAASGAGLRVVLIERYGFVGGLASSAMVGTVCGLYYRSQGGARYAVQGFARAFGGRLALASGTAPIPGVEGLYFLPYAIDAFHRLALDWLRQGEVQLRLHAVVTGVTVEERRIVTLTLHETGTACQIDAKTVVDCTGEALLSRLAGLPCHPATDRQANAFVFRVAGLPELPESSLMLTLIRTLRRGIEQGNLDPVCERLSVVPGSLAQDTALFKLGLPGQGNGTQDELTARNLSHTIVAFLRDNEPALADLTIAAMAAQVGIRSGPRPLGLGRLDEAAVLACAKPEDGVAIGTWPVEYWGQGRKPRMHYFALDNYYLVPAPALVSRDLDNLFFAGRGFSATEMAMASARVIGTCLGTGYAAGMLAAAQKRQSDWRLGIEAVRNRQVLAAL